MKHGEAISIDAFGNSYKSMWENNKRFTGYVGERNSDGERHGQGTEFYSDGSLYDGQWKNDVKDGTGRVIYLNGLEFMGLFTDGIRNGNATITWPDGKIFKGFFTNDSGDGTITFGKDIIYTGEINVLGQMHGRYYYSTFTFNKNDYYYYEHQRYKNL